MTTATDWDVRDSETNDRLDVTDVQAEIDRLDGAAAEAEPVDVHRIAEALERMTRRCDMLASENHELRKQLGAWTPRRDPSTITTAADLTERQRNAGLYRPAELDDIDRDGMPLHAIVNSGTWPTWLGDVHHADATWTQTVTDLRSWADSYTARPVERTVVQPVEVDYSYRQTEAALYAQMVVSAAEQHVASVYDELAPDRIHANVPPDNRVDRMIEDPERYFAEARQRAERQVQAELGADLEAGPPHRLPPGDFPMPDYADDPSSEPEPKPEPEQPADRAGLVKLAKRVPTALTTGEQPAQAEPERRGRLRRMWDAIRNWDGTGA